MLAVGFGGFSRSVYMRLRITLTLLVMSIKLVFDDMPLLYIHNT